MNEGEVMELLVNFHFVLSISDYLTMGLWNSLPLVVLSLGHDYLSLL